MDLTIAQLAIAVDRSENYIRQHINRQHLTVHRDGRNVFVDIEEAMRWARERGLPLTLPHRVILPIANMRNRAARMTVLTWHPGDSEPINVFTHVRHRRHEDLGPWVAESDGTWSSEVVLSEYSDESEEFRLYVIDVPLDRCYALVNDVLDKGVLEIDDCHITYFLEQMPRHHRAYRDQRQDSNNSVKSPFSNYSSEVTEYWSFEDEPRERWLKVAGAAAAQSEPLLKGLRFRLERRPDRVGNLMIAGAEDMIHCELSAQGKTLVLRVEGIDGGAPPPHQYTATVWGSHSDDNVMRNEVAITQRETVIDLPSEVDRIGCAIYRRSDGQCIDYFESYLVMSISFEMHVESGETVEIRDNRRAMPHRFNPGRSREMFHIDSSRDSTELDKRIRREVLSRRSFERDIAPRRERSFGRFGPDRYDAAAEFFLGLLHRQRDSTRPIYLADPYFMAIKPGDEQSKLYLHMFEATAGNTLHILCSPVSRTKPENVWWSNYPTILTGHVTVRELIGQSEHGRAFHDRYLIVGDREILISNSFTGWRKDGVTFVGIPEGEYRAEAEKWWALDIGATHSGYLVCEV